MKRTFLPFLLLLALLTGCRYEDGPLVSFRSPWTRLTMHPKKLTRLEMDGVDYLPMFNADFPNSTFRFTREGHWGYYIIYWSSDRFTEPVWAGMNYNGVNSSHLQSMSLNMYGIDHSKSDVLDYVQISVIQKYIRLLVADTISTNGYYIQPSYEISKLTAESLQLKNRDKKSPGIPDGIPPRFIYFKSI